MENNGEVGNVERSLACSAALGVMVDLELIWTELFKIGSADEFIEKIIGPMGEMPDVNGDDMGRILDSIMDTPAELLAAQLKKNMPAYSAADGKEVPPHVAKIRMIELAMFEAACLYVVQAVRADILKAPEKEQWELACEARRRLGMLQGYMLGNRERGNAMSAIAKLGADALHKENRAMKQQVEDWCDKNLHLFGSMEAAAEALREVVPLKHRTLVGHVKAFKKSKPLE